jgi:KDO2-lipid IV(A) lauroyltransferase
MFRILPRRTALFIGRQAGSLASYADRRDYRLAVEHLTIAFGSEKSGEEIRRLARDVFRYAAMNFVDTARLAVMSPDEINRVSVAHNIEHLNKIVESGKSSILLTGHTGCWELMGAWLSMNSIPLSVISKRLYDSRLENLILETRKKHGMENISRGRNTRDILRAFKKGRHVGLLTDQDTNVKGVFVDFFGKPAHTATAPAQLHLKYRYPIIPTFAYRDSRHRHHFWFGELIDYTPTGDREKDEYEVTEMCSKVTEQFIREHPEQWVWFHRRWKKQPDPDGNTRAGS